MIVSLDIDGVLVDYPNCWLEFIKQETGKSFINIAEAKSELGSDYRIIKAKYRESSFKRNLELKKDASIFIEQLKTRDYKIKLSTSRPLDSPEYPKLRELTEDWCYRYVSLAANVEYKDKGLANIKNLDQITFHVEDEWQHAKEFLKKGVFVYFIAGAENVMPDDLLTYPSENLVVIQDLTEIIYREGWKCE